MFFWENSVICDEIQKDYVSDEVQYHKMVVG